MEMAGYLRIGIIVPLIVQMFLAVDSQRTGCAQCAAGTVCKTVRGIFGITVMSVGYNPVVTIPAGACNINITEAARSVNHLAIKTGDGDYKLNGHWIMEEPGVYYAGGTPVVYSRNVEGCPGECIRAVGPLAKELTIQLLYHGRSPGIYYSYQKHPLIKPRENKPSPGYGELREPEIGSQSVETPELPEIVTAVDKSNIEPATRGSFPEYSPYPSRSDITRRGPIFSSEFTRYRPPAVKAEAAIDKPANQEQREALTDVTYSRGVNDVDFKIEDQNELPNVISKDDVVYQPENDSFAGGAVVSVLEKYSWKVSGYSNCSRICGGGIQETVHICVETSTLQEVSISNCENTIKPEVEYLVCNDEPCTPKWVKGVWSQCSTTCGQGQMTRNVTCHQRISATDFRPLQDKHCTSQKPATVRDCYGDDCFSWQIGEWGECSTPCGVGVKRRPVKCINGLGEFVPTSYCDQSKPSSKESCDMGSCTRHWYHSKWSGTCLNNCDSGVVTREVHCATDTGYILPDSKCKRSNKPKSREVCRQGITCGGKWFAGPWSKCSQSCGEGVKTRQIVCMKKIGDQQVVTSDDNCVDDEKPETTDKCTESDCGHTWFMTDWSKCSKTCGGGIKTRSVMCMKDGGKISTLCDISRRPENTIACNSDKCWTRPRQNKKGCVNKYPNCHVVVQARLCRYWYYQRKCCASCSDNLHSANQLT